MIICRLIWPFRSLLITAITITCYTNWQRYYIYIYIYIYIYTHTALSNEVLLMWCIHFDFELWLVLSHARTCFEYGNAKYRLSHKHTHTHTHLHTLVLARQLASYMYHCLPINFDDVVTTRQQLQWYGQLWFATACMCVRIYIYIYILYFHTHSYTLLHLLPRTHTHTHCTRAPGTLIL